MNPYTFMKGNDAKRQQIYSEYAEAQPGKKDKKVKKGTRKKKQAPSNTENKEKDSKNTSSEQERHEEAVKENCTETDMTRIPAGIRIVCCQSNVRGWRTQISVMKPPPLTTRARIC